MVTEKAEASASSHGLFQVGSGGSTEAGQGKDLLADDDCGIFLPAVVDGAAAAAATGRIWMLKLQWVLCLHVFDIFQPHCHAMRWEVYDLRLGAAAHVQSSYPRREQREQR